MVHSNSLAHTSGILTTLFSAMLLNACAGYSVSVNDNPVYNPPTLFTDFRLVDGALHDCVQQTIEDQTITQASQLTQLNCSSAGIETLEGLSAFPALRALSLKDNAITELRPLKPLSRLEILLLEDNDIRSAEPLLALLRLKELDLSGNTNLACGDAQQLKDHSEGEITLPEHCR
ncbi:leucine-rich repeat domain-containing protein [Marinimicrobium locisalis]|uniref:leucine-rich repeat domain-containing protein n=1 Tax=Marinimicrobium locisalis TaxID=546022 RepID=UPI003221A64C